MLTRYDGEPHKFFTNILHKLCSPYQQRRFLYASHIIFSTLMAAFYIMDEPKHIRVYLAKKIAAQLQINISSTKSAILVQW